MAIQRITEQEAEANGLVKIPALNDLEDARFFTLVKSTDSEREGWEEVNYYKYPILKRKF